MTFLWSKTVLPIAAIFSFRMLGLFMLIPVFTIYALDLREATPTLIGFALGGYGLTQGLLQIPFGMLSDKFGRKPILSLGLLLFALGSLIGALTDSIYGMILARIIQGTGAIGSVLIALLADLTPEYQRTKAMAVIGMTIGTSFGLAMIISPILAAHFGLSAIFYFTAVLAFMGLLLLHLIIPNPVRESFSINNKVSLLKSVLSNRHLQKLNLGIFCLHFILTSTFFAIPMLLSHQIKAGQLTTQWHFYLPLMLGSFLLMLPVLIWAEKKKQMKSVFLVSVLTTIITQGFLAFIPLHWVSFCLSLFIYFISFNFLEAFLPSAVSKQADKHNKGTAMGIYSTGQFLGIFAGGSLAGLMSQWHGNQGIFIMNALLGSLWFVLASLD